MTTNNSIQVFPTVTFNTSDRTLSAIVAQPENGQSFFGAASLANHACGFFNELNVNALPGYVRVNGRKYHSSKVYDETFLNSDELARLGAVCISTPAKAATLINLVTGISAKFGVKAFSNKYPVVDMAEAQTAKVAGKDVRVCTTANGTTFVNFEDLVAVTGAERAELAERVLKAIQLHQVALFLADNNAPVAFLPLEAVINLLKADKENAEIVAGLTKASRKVQNDYADAQVLAPQALDYPLLVAQIEHTTFRPNNLDYTEVEAQLHVAKVEAEVTADADEAQAEVKAETEVKAEAPVLVNMSLEQLKVNPDADDTEAQIKAIRDEAKARALGVISEYPVVVAQPELPVEAASQVQASFDFEGCLVRTETNEDGVALFCLTDVCAAMELTDPSNVVRQIKGEFGTPVLNTGVVPRPNGSTVSTTFITEPQLYFVMMRGRSDIAHKFRQWMCNEVLPSLRKRGYYGHCHLPAVPVEGTMSYVKFADALVGTLKGVGIDIRDQLDFIINRARKQGVAIVTQDHSALPNKVTASYLASMPEQLSAAVQGQFDELKTVLEEIKCFVKNSFVGADGGDTTDEQVKFLKEWTNTKVDENVLASIDESHKRLADKFDPLEDSMGAVRAKGMKALETASRCIALLEQAIEASYMPEYRKRAYRQIIEEANRALIELCA